MDEYNSAEFAQAVNQFQKFYNDYTYKDELYSTAKFYEADALWKIGELDAAATGFNYLIVNFSNSNFMADAVYNLSMIYFQLKRYNTSRFYFLKFTNTPDWGITITKGECRILLHRISNDYQIVHCWLNGLFKVEDSKLVISLNDNVLLKEGSRSEEHTSELQSHSFISYAVFCLKKKRNIYY